MSPALLAAVLTLAPAADPTDPPSDPAWLHVRGGLPWTHVVMFKGGPVRVVFLGGSITEGNGFRPLVEAGLRDRFPETEWSFQNAGIASAGSTTGVFRFFRDAVRIDGARSRGATVVVAEAAVNDDQDERLSAADAGWGMEGIARMPSNAFGNTRDKLFVHFPNPAIVEKLRAGEEAVSVAAHERVAERYDIPSVNVAAEVARRIDEGTLTWEEYGGTHPGPVGHRLAADMIVEAIARSVDPKAHEDRERRAQRRSRLRQRGELPSGPLRADAVDRAFLLEPGNFGEGVDVGAVWATSVPDWSSLPGNNRDRFQKKTLLHTTMPGATLIVDPAVHPFTALGLYVLAGPDAGAVEVTVPGEEPKVVQLYHDPHSKRLHYPRTVLLYRSDKPPAGPLTVKVVKGERGGTAVRIVGVGLGFINKERLEATPP